MRIKGGQFAILLASSIVFVSSYVVVVVVVVEIQHTLPDAVAPLISIFIRVVALAAVFIFIVFVTDRVAIFGILVSVVLMFASTVELKDRHTFWDLIVERAAPFFQKTRAAPLLLSFFAVTFTLFRERAAKLLERAAAADHATCCRKAKRLVRAWKNRTFDFVVHKHRMVALLLHRRRRRIPNNLLPLPSSLHGMAMASYYEMVVLDFVERGQTTSVAAGAPSPSWLLGVSGMRGVGKTTLLRHVRDAYAHSGSSFSRVFFVGAAGATTVDRLQRVLAVNMGLGPPPPPPQASSDDAARIISTCLRGKTFLLLLDDVRERLDLAAVALPMPLGHRQKVIFTTRNQAICGEMGCTSSIQMGCLGEGGAWSLFKDKVGDEIIDAHPHIHNLAKKMSAECRGLPSALCALGRAMSTKRDVKEWRYAYETLKRKMMERRPPVDDEIQEVDDDDDGEAYSDLHALVDELQDSGFF